MLFDLLEFIPDRELVAILDAALQAAGGRVSREASCDLAYIGAEHLLERLALEGVRVVRVPRSLPLKD